MLFNTFICHLSWRWASLTPMGVHNFKHQQIQYKTALKLHINKVVNSVEED